MTLTLAGGHRVSAKQTHWLYFKLVRGKFNYGVEAVQGENPDTNFM